MDGWMDFIPATPPFSHSSPVSVVVSSCVLQFIVWPFSLSVRGVCSGWNKDWRECDFHRPRGRPCEFPRTFSASWLGDRLSIMSTTTTCQRPQRYLPQRAAQTCAADVVEALQLLARTIWHQYVAVWCPDKNGELSTSSVQSLSIHSWIHISLFLLDYSKRDRGRERAGFSQFQRLHSETMDTPPICIFTWCQSCQGGIPPRHPTITWLASWEKAVPCKRRRVLLLKKVHGQNLDTCL